MKKPLLFILILFVALSLHAQTHKHYKDTIDVVMESSGILTQPQPVSVLICPGTHTFTLGAVSGSSGTSSYTWQMSYDNENWTNVQGPNTTLNYTTPSLEWGTVTYFRRIATNSGCSTVSNSAAVTVVPLPPRPEFMAYNLGADSTLKTPKLQMAYLANDANGATATTTNYGRVFGGRYQWGRKPVDYAIDPSTYLLYAGNDAANHAVAWSSTMTYTNGQLDGQNDYHVYTPSNNSNWNSAQDNSLWGNGSAIGTATPGTGAVLCKDGGYYQKPVKTVNDPCPSGYRVPTENDWELMCNYDCSPNYAGGIVSTGSAGVGKTNTGLTWVRVKCSGGTCKMATLAANARGGYAVYKTSDWESAGYTTADDLITATVQPLLFLPAAGQRNGTASGTANYVGSYGCYWSSSIIVANAYFLTFYNALVGPSNGMNRAEGLSVRCVKCTIGEDCYVPEP